MEKVGRMTVATLQKTQWNQWDFIVGGDFVKDGLSYHEPYRLKLIVEKKHESEEEQIIYSRSQRRRHCN